MKFIYVIIFSLLLGACSEETPFTNKPLTQTFNTPAAEVYTTINCANHTTINPQLDILFLVDNSTSTFYIPSELKSQISNLLTGLSNYHFDFHAMVAPILAESGETNLTQFPVIATNPSDFSASVNVVNSSTLTLFSATEQTGSVELGFRRARDIINANISNNVFRTNSNTIIINISNGDDTDYYVNNWGVPGADNFNSRLADFRNFTAAYNPSGALKSRQFRFISVVAHSKNGVCTDYKIGSRYRNMSKTLYMDSGQSDQSGKTYPDSYDVCTGSFSNIFNDLSVAIPQIIIPHTYNYWPVKDVTQIDWNPNEMVVKKVIKSQNGDSIVTLPESQTDGWQFDNTYRPSINIRETPAASAAYPAEIFSGFFVQLHGSAKVTSPDCLIVQIQDPYAYWGFYLIKGEPDTSRTVVKKNGVVIPHLDNPQTGQNGWSYAGDLINKNSRISAPGVHGENGQPQELISGHMIKLWGTATLTNEDSITITLVKKTN